MDIYLYQCYKDINSTKRPTGGLRVEAVLKAPSDLLSPLLRFETQYTAYNYVYIPAFSRYYFIDGWEYAQPNWIARLSVDMLASFKEFIGNSRQYVLRAASAYNGSVIDRMYPLLISKSSETSTPSGSVWWDDLRDGMYIVGIIGKGAILDTVESGVITYYAMDATAFQNFRSNVFDDTLAFYKRNGSFGDVTDEIARMLVDVFQYIASCVFVPYNPTGVSVDNIGVGFWSWSKPSGSVCKRVSIFNSYFFNSSIAIPKHPQSSRGAYLNAIAASHTLTIPGVGTVDLDANALADADSVQVVLSGDAYSGSGKCKISAVKGSGAEQSIIQLYNIPVNIGVPITLANSERATGSLLNSAVNVASSLVSGNYLTALGGAVEGVTSAPKQQSNLIGSNGSFAMLRELLVLNSVFETVADEMLERFGRPLCESRVLNTLQGFVQCQDAHIEIGTAMQPELEGIESFLNGGFYYE